MNNYGSFNYDPFNTGFDGVGALFGVFGIFWFIICGIFLIVHIIIAVHVYRDAKKQTVLALGLSPWLWTLISLAMPVGGMALYWLMNRSTLVRRD